MTVTFVAQGSSTSTGTAPVTPAYPPGVDEGIIAVALVDSGHPTAATMPSTPDGWTLLGTVVGTSGTYGADAGPRRLSVYMRQLESATDDAPTFTMTTGTESRLAAAITLLSITAGSVLRWALATGQDAASGTGFSVAGSAVGWAPGDFAWLAGVASTDAVTWSAQAVAATGVTFSAATERLDQTSGVGADASRTVATCTVTAGTATSAPTLTATLSGSAIGVGAVLRLREVTADIGPATLTATYDSTLSGVLLTAASLDANADTVDLERSVDGGATWTAVRGGTALPVDSNGVVLTDYEFIAGAPNLYRVVGHGGGGGMVTDIETAPSIAPYIIDVWVKSVARPFLNARVQVIQTAPMQVTQPARGGVFDIVGRTNPIAVTDVRKSRRWTMMLRTEDADDAAQIYYLLASGDVLLIQVPPVLADSIPAGYVTVGDATYEHHPLRPLYRTWVLPITEVAAPGLGVSAVLGTYQTVLDGFTDYAAVLAGRDSYADLLTLVGSPSEVIVP